MYAWLAYGIVICHFAFIAWVIFGGLLLYGHPWVVWLHAPSVVWGVLVQMMHWPCPLYPLEIWLRDKAGLAGYQEDFLSHYLLSALYPDGLSFTAQTVMGTLLLVFNLGIYLHVFFGGGR
jgi:hypothetical protein